VLVIALPAALGLALLAEALLAVIFYGGEFTAQDVAMSAASLQAFAPGLIGFILVKVLAPGYFARQDTRTPVRIAVRALLLSMVLNIVFVLTLLQTGWAPAHAGLAASTTCSGLFNATLLLAGLRKAGVYRSKPGWGKLFAKTLAGCIAMAAFLLWGLAEAGDWLVMSGWQRAGALTGLVAGGGVVYFAACYLFGLRPRDLRLAGSGADKDV
jgi:putative peptidoglycan lipid II flippase